MRTCGCRRWSGTRRRLGASLPGRRSRGIHKQDQGRRVVDAYAARAWAAATAVAAGARAARAHAAYAACAALAGAAAAGAAGEAGTYARACPAGAEPGHGTGPGLDRPAG